MSWSSWKIAPPGTALLLLLLAAPAAAQGGTGDPGQGKRWVPGHYEKRTVRVWVPPTTKRVWKAPVYRTARDPEGNPVQILVRPGRYEVVIVPGRHETRTRRVWVPGRWVRDRDP